VIKLVHEPKEIIHAYGAAAGGEAVGVWAADNTEMFYPSAVPARDVLAQMAAAQAEVAAKCQVQVGLGMHAGESYVFELGDGNRDIAGNPVNLASKLAEDSGGEGVIVEEGVRLPPGTAGAPFNATVSGVEIRAVRL